MIDYKIITLTMNDKLKNKILNNYIKNNKSSNIQIEKSLNSKIYSIKYINKSIEIYNKNLIEYFRESNIEYFKNIDAVIIFLKSKNINVINDLKNIWLQELKYNNVAKNLPILIVNYRKTNLYDKKLFRVISDLTKDYKSTNGCIGLKKKDLLILLKLVDKKTKIKIS